MITLLACLRTALGSSWWRTSLMLDFLLARFNDGVNSHMGPVCHRCSVGVISGKV